METEAVRLVGAGMTPPFELGSVKERVWIARALLTIVVQGYSAGGIDLGRSCVASHVEAARDMLGPMPREFYEWLRSIDYDADSLLQRARVIRMEDVAIDDTPSAPDCGAAWRRHVNHIRNDLDRGSGWGV